jgi:hypothetical protein
VRIWIDIEDGSGAKQGDGPIVSARGWRSRERLDRAGTVDFDTALTDPRSADASAKRVVRCRGLVNELVADLGVGIVDKRQARVTTGGQLGMAIEGDNLMRELSYRHVGSLLISDGAGGTDDDGPTEIMALAPAGWSLVSTGAGYANSYKAVLQQFEGETILTALIRLAELTGEHFRLGTGRTIEWLRRSGSAKLVYSSSSGAFTLGETIIGKTSGATGTLREDDAVNTWLYVEDAIGNFSGSEIVEGITSGETATLSAAYNPDSGIRAVPDGDPGRLKNNTHVCIITDLQEIQDTYESYVGRLYAYGVGNGAAKITLNGTATAVPGWTVANDAKGDYLEHTSTWNAYGIESRREWKDLESADTLLEAGYEWMLRQLGAQRFYKLSVAKLDATLRVGEYIRVIYRKTVDGYTALNVNALMLVLEIETEVDEEGMRTAGLTVATIDRWPEDDSSAVVSQASSNQDYYQHTQPAGIGAAHRTTHEDGGTDEISVAGLSGELADNQPPKAHKADHEAGGGDALSGNLSITDLALSGKVTQGTQTIGAFFTKQIVDATATSVFRIATTNEAGNTDGGGYSVWVHALIDHGCDNATANASTKSFTAQFCRIMLGAGTGVSSAVSAVVETAPAANGLVRTIGTVTMTVVETSEYNVDVQFNVDLTGSTPGTGTVHVWVQLVWAGFLTAPVMSQL